MRPLSCPGRTAALAAGRAGTASTSLVARVAVPCGPIQARRVAAGWTCRAARRDTGPSIGDMNQDERLRRLEELTGQAQNMRTPFSRESLLKDMGVIDPALYVDDEVADPEDVEKELEWIDWNEDPTTHNVVHARTETADDGMTQRLIATTDLEEDEAAIQVPLHNCLTLCMADDDDGLPDSIERQNAVLGFYNMQSALLDQWEDHHGRLPLALRSLLLDFTKGAPTSRTKMALWLLWVADGDCGSAYWREVLGALPKAEDMPNLEFCGPAELAQLQWGPAGLEAAARRDALEAFYQGFSASPLCAAFGWQPTREESVWEAEAMGASVARQVIRYYAASQGCPDPAPRGEDDYSPGRSFLDELDEALDEMEQEAGSGSGSASASGSKSKAAASKAAKKGAAKGGAKGQGGQGDGELSPPPPGYQLLPLPSFERFLWAYCTAEARSVGSGERLVFFPQADPFLYTTNPASVNCTLAIVGDDGPVMDEFAVVTTLYPVKEGEELRCSAPFGLGVDGGGGSSRQMLEVFGRVPLGPWQCGGNEADGVDLEPEVGSPLDTWLKQLTGQEADTRLDSVTDPRLNHLLTLARAGDVDAQAQLPALRNILPALDVPKLYGPSLIAGVQRIMPMELHFDVDPAEAEQMKQDLLEDEQVAMEARRARAAAAAAKLIPGLEQYESYDILGAGTATAADIAYGETEAWKQDTTITKIVDVPTDPEQFTTPEGHADYRRMVAAWSSLPRVQPSDVRHRDDMAAALAGEPVGKILTTARELSGELARARAVRDKFQAVIDFFPTDIDTDWQLIEKAKKSDSGSGSAEPEPAPAASSASAQDPEPASESGSGSAEVAVVKQYQRPAVNVPGGMDMIWDVKLPWEAGPTAITHPRQHGIVAWRLEHKLVWGHMLGMTKEYVQSLEEALAEAGGEEAVAAEEAAALAAAEAAAAEGEEGDWVQGRRA